MLKYKNKVEKGITLIALVITIIVLLILAGISITMLSGDNSILNRAGQAKNKTELTSLKEETQTVMLGRTTEKTISGNNSKTLKEELESNVSNATVESINATEESEGLTDVYYVRRNGQYVTVYNDGNIIDGKVSIWKGINDIESPKFEKDSNDVWNWYIYTAGQLKFLADFVNKGNGTDLPKDLEDYVSKAGYDINDIKMSKNTIIYLMNNLDLGARPKEGNTEEEKWGANPETQKWTPIGLNKDNVLNKLGTFEGNNFSIRGVYVKRIDQFNGLFGWSNKIQNLTIENSFIYGLSEVGGITGVSYEDIVNCHNNNTTIEGQFDIGGIVGSVSSIASIENCSNNGKIKAIQLNDNWIFHFRRYRRTIFII